MEQSVAGRASMAELESWLSVILLWGLHEGNQQTEQATERKGLFSNRAVWLGVIFSLTDVVNSQLFDRFTIRDIPHYLLHCMDVFEWIGTVAGPLNGDRFEIGTVLLSHSQIKWVSQDSVEVPGAIVFMLTLPRNTTLSSTSLCSWFQCV